MDKTNKFPNTKFDLDNIQWVKRNDNIHIESTSINTQIHKIKEPHYINKLEEKMTVLQQEKTLKDLIPLTIPIQTIIDKLNLRRFVNIQETKSINGIYKYLDFEITNNDNIELKLFNKGYKLKDSNIIYKVKNDFIQSIEQDHNIDIYKEIINQLIEEISTELFKQMLLSYKTFGIKNANEINKLKLKWYDKIIQYFNNNYKTQLKIKNGFELYANIAHITNRIFSKTKGISNNFIVIFGNPTLPNLLMENYNSSIYNESLRTNSLFLNYISSFPKFELYYTPLLNEDEMLILSMPTQNKALDTKLNLIVKDTIDVITTEIADPIDFKLTYHILGKIYFELSEIQNKTYTNYYFTKLNFKS